MKYFMPRAKAISQSVFPYNISARCINKEWFHLPMEQVWDIFCEELNRSVKHYELLVHSFVLMSNHFHLIASTPRANISQCMHQLMHRSSRRLTKEGNRINATFAGRHYKCILQHNNNFLNAYKYNYQNPVRAGVCARVEDYPFSTLNALAKAQRCPIPIAEDTIFLSDPVGTLAWLNSMPDPQKLEGVRFGLKHQFFKSKRDGIVGDRLIEQDELL